jgi:hypothetical protein
MRHITCKKCGAAIEFEKYTHIDSVGSLTSPYIVCKSCGEYNYEFDNIKSQTVVAKETII